MTTLRIATRASTLARWQADRVASRLHETHGTDIEMVLITTTGDQRRDVPIHTLGGTGVFVKEVQQAVLEGRADIAVHSAKDLPSVTADGLAFGCVPERADARDALIGSTLADLRNGAVVATGSVRRRTQLHALRPDLVFAELRGNIDTRIDRASDFDAIVLAVAGVERIGRAGVITERLEFTTMMPQIGQGALAIECRAHDDATRALLQSINNPAQFLCVSAERAFLAGIGGGCEAPVGAHAYTDGEGMTLNAIIADAQGNLHRASSSGNDPATIGAQAAEILAPHATSSNDMQEPR